ncbi:hypothetical protein TRICHSKD4_1064 [Roseibium sp. TrichSKD4]|nr:hypothetical protein TRICHSKD4_2383 [Roseibium sp. TrichSKD4]EFO33945.1 hypothetical protein TRICHSKD4_1064 [Roseibium sp. TrichSKD4]
MPEVATVNRKSLNHHGGLSSSICVPGSHRLRHPSGLL